MNQDHKIDSRYKMTTFFMPKTFRLLLTLWLLSFSVRNIHAQFNNFPVSSTPFIVHTNTYQWSDFYTSSTFLNLNLLLKDNKQGGDLDVFLRIKLERVGITISNPPDFVASKPIRLNFGSLKSLSGIDISENFLPQNLVLSGLEDSFVRQGGTLPDGLWTIKVTAYEFDGSRGYRQVSNEGIGQLMVFYGQPPMLLAPANTSEIDNSFSPNVLFNWLPKATASIGGLSNIAYEFELWELGDNEDPNEVALGKTPIFTKTVSSPMMLYDAHQQPPLKTGFHYAWRVRVIDATGNNAYENKGYSEVWSFRYGIKCSDTGNLQIKLLGGRTYRLTWDYAKTANSYEINWRERGKSVWQIENSHYNNFDLKLEESLAYEFRVRTVCQSGETGAWSEGMEWEKDGGKQSQFSSARMSAMESVGGTSTTTSSPEDDLNRVLNPLGNTVTSGELDPDKANALLKKPDDNITRCNSGVKTTTASCDDDKSVAYTGGVSFPSPAIGTKLYLNGYEIVLTSGNASKGEGLLFFPYLMKRIPVEWTGIQINTGEESIYGCIVGKADKVQVQGSNSGALADDLNRQFTALAAWLNDPGSFTGTFGEALELVKKSAIGEETSTNDIGKYSKAVSKGIKEWITKIDILISSNTIPPTEKNEVISIKQDLVDNIAFLKSIEAKPLPVNLTNFEKNKLIELPKYIQEQLRKLNNALLPSNEGYAIFAIPNSTRFDNNLDKIDMSKLKKLSEYEILNISGADYFVPWLIIKENETIPKINVEFKKKIENYIKSGKTVTVKTSTEGLKINGVSEIIIDKTNYVAFERGFSLFSTIDDDEISFSRSYNIKMLDEEGKIVGKINILAGKNIIKKKKVTVYYVNHGNGTNKSKFSLTIIKNTLSTSYKDAFVEWELTDGGEIDVSAKYNLWYKNKNDTNFNDIGNLVISSGNKALWDNNNGFFITNLTSSPSTGSFRNGTGEFGGNLVIWDTANSNTFVHECGHVLTLPHTFCCFKNDQNTSFCKGIVGDRCTPEKSTLNLMDYYEGFDLREHFIFYQWKTIYDNAN